MTERYALRGFVMTGGLDCEASTMTPLRHREEASADAAIRLSAARNDLGFRLRGLAMTID
jgi:hypothetical protein